MKKKDVAIGIAVGDLHLRATCPVARAEKHKWMEVQERYLTQLAGLANNYGAPVLYPGDLFDRWNSPPELINFALKYLPWGYAVPGQHDLPHHSYEDKRKSAYWTMAATERIEDIPPGEHRTQYFAEIDTQVNYHGFPWGYEVQRLSKEFIQPKTMNVAIAHSYIWMRGESDNPHPREDDYIDNYVEPLKKYDFAVFGDNHKGFSDGKFFNGGTFMCLRMKDHDFDPRAGILMADGSMRVHYFDTVRDKWVGMPVSKEDAEIDLDDFLSLLQNIRDDTVNFDDAISYFLRSNKINSNVRRLILKAVEVDKK